MRGVGIKAAIKKKEERKAAAAVGQALAEDNARHIETQIAGFRTKLEEFASKYRHEINRDPQFRCVERLHVFVYYAGNWRFYASLADTSLPR